MSGLSQDTYAAAGVLLSAVGSGGGGPVSGTSTFSTIYVSETAFIASLAAASVSTMILEAEEAAISSISSFYINAVDIGCSTISTLGVVLDGNLLTSAGNELLLNGIPLATNSSLSTIADWARDPAISTVQMNNNPIVQSSGYTGTGTVSTTDLRAVTGSISSLTGGSLNYGNAYISTLVCSDISTVTLTVQSTIHSISSISSLVVAADALFVSSINGGSYPPPSGGSVSSFDTASVSSLTVSSINGAVPGSVANWSQFPAVSNVNISTHALNFIPFTGPGGIVTGYTNSQFDTNITMGSNSTIILPKVDAFVSQFNIGGLTNPAGSMTVVASGSIGLNSALGVDITGLGGVTVNSIGGVSVLGGGGIAIDGGGGILVDGGNVSINGAGLVSIESLSGLAIGAGGVAITGGAVLVTGGTGVAITGGAGVSVAGGGGVVVAAGGAVLSPAATISSLSVSSINGGAYPPTYQPPSNAVVSTLVAATYVSTPQLIVSTINGVVPGAANIPSSLVVSSLLAAEYVSAPQLLVSSLNGYRPSDPVVSSILASGTVSAYGIQAERISSVGVVIRPDGGVQGGIKLSGNTQAPGISMPLYFEILNRSTIGLRATYIGDDEVIDYISHPTPFSIDAGLHASLAAKSIYLSPVYGISSVSLSGNSANSSIIASVGMSVSSLTDISTINGAAYPPVASLPSDAVVSTLTAADLVSSTRMNVSSIGSGDTLIAFQAGDVINITSAGGDVIVAGASLTVNTDLFANFPIYVSSLVNVSSINDAPYPPVASLPSNAVVSTLTAATSVSTPALFISSINGAVYPPAASVPSNLVVSTLVAADYVSSAKINNSSIGIGGTVISFNALDDAINITANGGDVSVSGASLTVNTDLFANYSIYVSSLVNVSSINGEAYPPVASLPPNAVVSTLVAATSISTPSLFVSSINGASLTPSSIANGLGYINIDGNGAISTTTGGLQTFAVEAAGKISLRSNAIGLDLWDSDGGSRIIMNGSIAVSGTALNIGEVTTSVSTLVGVNTINGAAYPPPASIPTALTVSTVVAADFVSSPILFVSSVNGAPYPPPSGASSNGEFSTVVVSSILTAKDIVTTSSLTMGDPNASTCAFIRSPAGGSPDVVVELGVAGVTNGALRVYNSYTLGTGGILESRQLYNISSISNSLPNGNDITLTAGPGTAGVTGYVNITDPITPYGKLRVAQITELSSINGGIPALQFSEVTFGQVVADTLVTTETYTSSLTVSSINGFQIYPARSAFTNAPIYSTLTLSTIILASTTIIADIPSYCLVQANGSFRNATNQDKQIGFTIAVDGVLSPSTNATVYAGSGNTANCSIAFRQAVSTGTHTLYAYAIDAAVGNVINTQIDLWGATNLY